MLTIGLTGGIGSGKSTVAGLFSALGVPVIDSDQLARDAVLPGTPALQNITHHFGPDILLPDGCLDRNKLRKEIFAQKANRIWLEDLLHPIIRQQMAEQLDRLQAPYCIVQIPLLIGRPPNPLIQRILLVDTDPAHQLERVQQRDQIDPETIHAIMDSQADRVSLLAAADEVIVNNSSLDDLKKQVSLLHQRYLSYTHRSSHAG